jgi:uncharacterized membrane protein YedE/YeeE
MSQILAALVSGLLFGLGLAVSGMTKPHKVAGFLDLFGDWDPSLAFVMMGAIGVHAAVYHLVVKRRAAPFFAPAFGIPTKNELDGRLLSGAALFGVGWGITGFCPGPALVSLGVGSAAAGAVVAGMLGGVLLYRLLPAPAKLGGAAASPAAAQAAATASAADAAVAGADA